MYVDHENQKSEPRNDEMVAATADGLRRIWRYSSKKRLSDRKSTRLNSSHVRISYAVFCLKKKKKTKSSYSEISFMSYYAEINLDRKEVTCPVSSVCVGRYWGYRV